MGNKVFVGRFILQYEKLHHQDFVLKCGQLRLGRVGQNGRNDAWWHIGSSWDTEEAKICGHHLPISLSEAKKILEREVLKVLNSMEFNTMEMK